MPANSSILSTLEKVALDIQAAINHVSLSKDKKGNTVDVISQPFKLNVLRTSVSSAQKSLSDLQTSLTIHRIKEDAKKV